MNLKIHIDPKTMVEYVKNVWIVTMVMVWVVNVDSQGIWVLEWAKVHK